MPVVTAVESRMQNSRTGYLARVIDHVLGLVWKLPAHALQCEGSKVRRLFFCKRLAGTHLGTGSDGWIQHDDEVNKESFHRFRFSNGEMVYRCVCVDQWQCRELPNEKLNTEFRSSVKSSGALAPRRHQDEVGYPLRYGGPGASDREWLPARRLRLGVAC